MKKTIQTLVVALLCTIVFDTAGNETVPVKQVISKLKAQEENFHAVDLFQTPQSRHAEGLGTYTYFTLDEDMLKKVFKSNFRSVRMVLPLPGNDSVALLLTQHKILADDFMLTQTTDRGEQRTQYAPGLYYQGIIEGKENSLVAISIFKDHVGGMISDEKGNWNLGKLEGTGRLTTTGNGYAFFNDKTFVLPEPAICGTTEREIISEDDDSGIGGQRAVASDCVRLFFDCDYDLYQYKSSSTTAVSDYVTLLFNIQSVLFGNESITTSLSGINVWTVADPFNLGSSQANMYAYSDYRQTNFNGNLAQLLARDAGGLGGIAWINVFCASYRSSSHSGPISYCDINGSYSAGALTFPTYTWDASATTHELGHNFGSRHTHWCGWTGGPIDNCNTCWSPPVAFDGTCTSGPNPPATGGTIMSYCHGCAGIGINFIAGFGQQPGDLIRSRVAAASCLTECATSCEATVTVNTPITSGSVQYSASDVIYGNSVIESGVAAIFTAGEAVILSAGFNAKTGSVFTGVIGTCPGAASSPAEETAGGAAQQEDALTNALQLPEAAVEEIHLSAHPNPFSDVVTISFKLPASEKVRVEIAGIDGRVVATLFDETAGGNQAYHVQFMSASLDNGMYFYRLITASGAVQNKKLLLIR